MKMMQMMRLSAASSILHGFIQQPLMLLMMLLCAANVRADNEVQATPGKLSTISVSLEPVHYLTLSYLTCGAGAVKTTPQC